MIEAAPHTDPLTRAHYTQQLGAFELNKERCRACGSAEKRIHCGVRLYCRRADGVSVSHSGRCDYWHPRGTLL